MDTQITSTTSRLHPMMMAAAVSVTLVSLLGVAAITGILPASHGTAAPSAAAPVGVADASPSNGSPARYLTSDGKLLEVVPPANQAVPVTEVGSIASARSVAPAPAPAPAVHHRAVHHAAPVYVQNNYPQAAPVYQQPYAPQHPVVNYINDMHPVGTGVGAVVGGLLGNQIGGGSGRKLATVAGVLMGGYAGNEIAHNRSPLPGQ